MHPTRLKIPLNQPDWVLCVHYPRFTISRKFARFLSFQPQRFDPLLLFSRAKRESRPDNQDFYALSDEAENAFYAVEELFNSIYQHTDKLMDEDVKKLYPDDFDEFTWRSACESITSFYYVHADAVRFFTKFIDQVIICSEKYVHLSPLERLAISNHEAIKNKLNDVVHAPQTSSTGVHAPDYELITLADGS